MTDPEFRSSRRPDDDYTAFELEERFGRFDDVDDPVVRSMLAHPSLSPAPCWDCGSTEHRDCSVPLTRRELDAIRLHQRNGSKW